LIVMDTPKPPQKPAQLLHDLESIRELLGDNSSEPPLLIDSLDPDSIPVLSDIVSAPPGPPPPFHATPAPKPTAPATAAAPSASPPRDRLNTPLNNRPGDRQHHNGKLRAAAKLVQQVADDVFVQQHEAGGSRRHPARLPRLLPPR